MHHHSPHTLLPHWVQVKHGWLQFSQFYCSDTHSPDITQLVVTPFPLHRCYLRSHPIQGNKTEGLYENKMHIRGRNDQLSKWVTQLHTRTEYELCTVFPSSSTESSQPQMQLYDFSTTNKYYLFLGFVLLH